MRTTLTLDDELLARATKLAGSLDRTALISAGLQAFIERESARRLAQLGGSQPLLKVAPRRREKPARVILADTSVWIDHLRRGSAELAGLLERGQVLMHPFVIGEIACGSLSKRELTLELLRQLPMAPVAEPDEALGFIAMRGLHGKGIGYVDVHLLASVALAPGAALWTRDKRLREAANAMGCAHDPG